MNDSSDEVVRLLREIRDGQQEALKMQRDQFALAQRQTERAERIQQRAEDLQGRSAQMISVARKALFTVLPILVVLIAYVTWLMFR